MKKIAIFPGSFDPFTRGHEHIVNQALTLFDVVVVAIGHNPKKSGMLSVENRKKLIEKCYAAEPRLVVGSYTTLTIELCEKMCASHIIRGLRNGQDLQLETEIQAINHHLAPQITTIYFITPPEMLHISSSNVRELHSFNRPVDAMLPALVRLEDYI